MGIRFPVRQRCDVREITDCHTSVRAGSQRQAFCGRAVLIGGASGTPPPTKTSQEVPCVIGRRGVVTPPHGNIMR